MKETLTKEPASARQRSSASTRSIAFVGLTIALIAVSAWMVLPLGPVPFTLQTFALVFALVALTPRQAVAAIVGYLLLGAVGVPVFSGMRGGIGVLAGPTGGFLWGWLLAVPVAAFLLAFLRKHFGGAALRAEQPAGKATGVSRARRFVQHTAPELLAAVVFTLISYACGLAHYMLTAHVGFEVAFLTCCAPFIVVDVLKIFAAVLVATQVRTVVTRSKIS